MGLSLYFYSKNKIEKETNNSINRFLTDEGFYKNIGLHDILCCYFGNTNSIDDVFCGLDLSIEISENTIYTNCCGCFENKVNFFKTTILIRILEKIKTKMIELKLFETEDKKTYKGDCVFPYFSNLATSLEWIKKLDLNDEIILIAI